MQKTKVISCPICDSLEVDPCPYGINTYECVKCGTVFQESESDKS